MAQQTKSASGRSNGSAPQTKRASSGQSTPRAKSQRGTASRSDSRSLSSKLKTPTIATGAAVAGLVGGLALSRGKSSRASSLANAAKQIGSFAESVGDLANEVRMVREGVAHNQKRSPVEVVLEGLTSRRT